MPIVAKADSIACASVVIVGVVASWSAPAPCSSFLVVGIGYCYAFLLARSHAGLARQLFLTSSGCLLASKTNPDSEPAPSVGAGGRGLLLSVREKKGHRSPKILQAVSEAFRAVHILGLLKLAKQVGENDCNRKLETLCLICLLPNKPAKPTRISYIA